MSWTLQRQPQQLVRASTSRRLLITVCILTLAVAILGGTALTYRVRAAQAAPSTTGNFQVDQDHGFQFSQNKQNEPAITRDPMTGVLIAGANDEIKEPLCPGTTVPLASPCPFKAGVPISAYYRSTDNGKTWTGDFLPGFNTIGRASGGDPSLDYGPRLCANGTFSFSCGVAIYYGSLADPLPEFGGEQVTVSRSYDDGQPWAGKYFAEVIECSVQVRRAGAWEPLEEFANSPDRVFATSGTTVCC